MVAQVGGALWAGEGRVTAGIVHRGPRRRHERIVTHFISPRKGL